MAHTDRLDSFDALLQAAREQPQPQRLLLVFVKTVLPEDSSDAQVARFESGGGGGLVPVMYTDKAANELTSFAGLVAEAREVGHTWGEHMTADWDKVVVGCMGGRHGQAPTPEDAAEPLKHIVRTLKTGGSLQHLAAFDRDGDPIQFQ